MDRTLQNFYKAKFLIEHAEEEIKILQELGRPQDTEAVRRNHAENLKHHLEIGQQKKRDRGPSYTSQDVEDVKMFLQHCQDNGKRTSSFPNFKTWYKIRTGKVPWFERQTFYNIKVLLKRH